MQPWSVAVVYRDLVGIEGVNEPTDSLEDFLLLVSVEEPMDLRFQ